MELFHYLRNAIVNLFKRGRLNNDLEEEMQHHLEINIDRKVQAGMSEIEARYAAEREFGNIGRLKEECRDSWGARLIQDLWRDVRYSLRSLWKSKAFSFAIIATLALCIGANTTTFSVLYDLILKPLPFENPDRIVKIYNIFKGGQKFDSSRAEWNQYVDFNEQADLFDGFVLSQPATKIIGGIEIEIRSVTSDFFDLMGVKPLVGRFFAPEEVYPGPGNVIVLTQTTWENDYGADPNAIGREIKFLTGPSHIVIGVAPRSLEALHPNAHFFTPYQVTSTLLNPFRRYSLNTDMWARLKPGVSREMAYAQLESLERRAIEKNIPQFLTAWNMNPQHFEVGSSHPLKSSLSLLQGGALFLVLVGCINIVNLLLVRASRRGPELAARHSFGAGKLVLARMMLVESLLLTIAGMLVGFLLAWGGIAAINLYLVVLFPAAQPVALGSTVFLWTLFLAAVMAAIMGLLPFALLWNSGRIQRMDQTRSASASSRARFLSAGMVITQVAITCILLTGAGLLIRSFRNVLNVDPGFDAARVISGYVTINSVYKARQEWVGVRKRILNTMREIPGTENVSFESGSVAVGSHLNTERFSIRGGSTNGESQPDALQKFVDAAYFDTMGIKLLEGRTFFPGKDEWQASYVIDESFADQYLGGRIAVGAEVHTENPPATEAGWKRVVGVVARANYTGLQQRDGLPVLYKCFEEYPLRGFTVLLRTTRSAGSVIRDMQAKLSAIDPRLHLKDATPLNQPLGKLHMDRQGLTVMAGIFASLALFLSAIGLYGVLSYDVQQRQREIGIRSAIGATPREILHLILGQGLRKTLIGLALGILASFFLTQFMKSLLFDVTALDPQAYAYAVGFLLVGAFAASYLPARRAVKLDPVESLRLE